MSQSVDNVNVGATVPSKAPIEFNCKIGDFDFKFSMADGTPLNETVSACLTYLEHFKNLYVQAVDNNKQKILDDLPKPTDTVHAELVEPTTRA